jgi:hypothetical protein
MLIDRDLIKIVPGARYASLQTALSKADRFHDGK